MQSEIPRPSVGTWLGLMLGFLLLVLGSGFASFAGFMLVFVSDSCGSGGDCRIGLITAGMAVTGIGPWLVTLIALVVAVVRGRRGYLFAWVPWISMAIAATVAAGGVLLAFAGAPQGS